MGRGARPSQRMIAELAQVSQSAVSLVVSGQAEMNRIPLATRERIERVMAEVGYVPNVAARSLKGRRNGLVGVYTYERVFPVREDNYYHEFLVGIEESAVDLGLDLVLFTSTLGTGGSRNVYERGMNRLRLADGAIFFGLARDDNELERLATDGYPFVFIGRRTIGGAEIPHVTADYAGGIGAVVSALVGAGHRRIRYVAGMQPDGPQAERRAAYLAHSREADLEPSLIEIAPDEVESSWSTLQSDGASALMVETVELAEAIAHAAAQRSLSIPRDLSVVLLDVPARGAAAGAWSHMALPRRAMGGAALRLLLARLDDPDAVAPVVLPVSAPDQNTIGPPAS